jgi:NAD(P)-dependent dehydrogenase (short-subunit alcohol dehydrogenase family)
MTSPASLSAELRQPAAGATTVASLVAGGSGALGTAVTRTLLREGHPVTATWRSERERDAVERELSGLGQLTLVQAELTDPAAVDAVVGGVVGLGAVVNLVGGYAAGKNVAETDLEDFERMLELNLVPGFLLARAAMPRLVARGGGSFVAVSARAALRPFAGAAGYITAKAGVLAFVQALDAEYRNQGVRCNAIVPSVIDTPVNRRIWPDADHSKWVSPDEIARVVRFLVSEDSAPTSGAAIPVYGRA